MSSGLWVSPPVQKFDSVGAVAINTTTAPSPPNFQAPHIGIALARLTLHKGIEPCSCMAGSSWSPIQLRRNSLARVKNCAGLGPGQAIPSQLHWALAGLLLRGCVWLWPHTVASILARLFQYGRIRPQCGQYHMLNQAVTELLK